MNVRTIAEDTHTVIIDRLTEIAGDEIPLEAIFKVIGDLMAFSLAASDMDAEVHDDRVYLYQISVDQAERTIQSYCAAIKEVKIN